ncbi:hypothetical protein [Lysinibacillus sphaericus]|uniref:hypothetical protein n=1 Tax=Lysinibacillus sphaericus TaxID=1421 RepID=UPI000C1750B7|nr:hypothetical protein [Lysinibacillus sphaericus]PIJ98127.1 hypothetical protein CTN02_10320 [Lysinibacillus sphaericus]
MTYRCPECGQIVYTEGQNAEYYSLTPLNFDLQRNYLVQREDYFTIPPDELTKLKGKKIRTTIQNLGTVEACVGNYNTGDNRVELSNIISIQDGVNHSTMGFLPSELVGMQDLNQTCTPTGKKDDLPSDKQSEKTVIKKTIISFGVPAPVWNDLRRTKTYRVYLEVTVPTIIKDQAQGILDSCMIVAIDRAEAYLSPYVFAALTALNPSPVVAALPGALGAATQAFTICVGSNPIIYPYLNQINLNIGSGYD